jgi:hypothetical protein
MLSDLSFRYDILSCVLLPGLLLLINFLWFLAVGFLPDCWRPKAMSSFRPTSQIIKNRQAVLASHHTNDRSAGNANH